PRARTAGSSPSGRRAPPCSSSSSGRSTTLQYAPAAPTLNSASAIAHSTDLQHEDTKACTKARRRQTAVLLAKDGESGGEPLREKLRDLRVFVADGLRGERSRPFCLQEFRTRLLRRGNSSRSEVTRMGLYDDDNATLTKGDVFNEDFFWAKAYSIALDGALKTRQPEGAIRALIERAIPQHDTVLKTYPN